ncbi:B-type lectin plumieribetin-like [Pagrus major]|uniref:B-type lectin plumieribetin-like n=1 Tax=Pagrus major TaxID=143350 RepID=UPI003CC8DB92
MTTNKLSKNEKLNKGEFLRSNNLAWRAVFQGNGNFVIYDEEERNAKWATGTHGSGANRLCMQSDCSLVLYDGKNKPIWSSGTYINEADVDICHVELTNDGNLVVYLGGDAIEAPLQPTSLPLYG